MSHVEASSRKIGSFEGKQALIGQGIKITVDRALASTRVKNMPRPENHAGKTVVYIPFLKRNSIDHILSTVGGFHPDRVDILARSLNSNGQPLSAQAMNTDRIKEHAKQQGWKKVQPEDVINSDSTTRDALFASLTNQHDMIYIRGHCEKGSDIIESSDHTCKIGVPDLVDHFKGRLPITFPGSIKLFCCESALGSGFLFWGSKSFGAKFKNAMQVEGYTSCSYFGYTSELGSWTQGGFKIGDKIVNGKKTEVRASTVRVPL